MRFLRYIPALVLLPLLFAACTDSPSSTVNQQLGEVQLEAISNNTAYLWYPTGYDAYPDAANQAAFNQAVSQIQTSYDPAQHTILMVLKPNCGCQNTQREFPRAMKTLDAAGVSHDNITLYVTDATLSGISDIRTMYNVDDAPTFIVFKNGVEKGRMILEPSPGNTIEQEFAQFFAAP